MWVYHFLSAPKNIELLYCLHVHNMQSEDADFQIVLDILSGNNSPLTLYSGIISSSASVELSNKSLPLQKSW